jgi:hypothetical protein
LEPPLCMVSSWVIKRVYIILIWNTISGSSNLDNCFDHCLIFILILHLKVHFNSSSSSSSSSSLLLLLLLFIIYIVNLPMVWPRSYRIIYYFDTPALGINYQLFGRINIVVTFHIKVLEKWVISHMALILPQLEL